MADNKTKQALSLLDLYYMQYKTKYGRAPQMNRFKEKWAMVDVIDSVGFDRAKEIMLYYFRCNRPSHQLQWFFYNFDRMDEVMQQLAKDEKRRAELRAKTAERVREWDIEHGSTGNSSSM